MNEKFEYKLTYEQAEIICEAVGVDIKTLANWEIGELIDKFIDEAVERLHI